MLKDLKASAIALYDGGWRAEDKDQLISEYKLTKTEADQLCEELKTLGRNEASREPIPAINLGRLN